MGLMPLGAGRAGRGGGNRSDAATVAIRPPVLKCRRGVVAAASAQTGPVLGSAIVVAGIVVVLAQLEDQLAGVERDDGLVVLQDDSF